MVRSSSRRRKPPGSTTARGWGNAHQQERKRWKPIVEAGQAYCQQGLNGSSGTCLHRSRWIAPGSRWDLGHNDARTGWIGPCHSDCNQRAGASLGGRIIAARRGGAGVQRVARPRPRRPLDW